MVKRAWARGLLIATPLLLSACGSSPADQPAGETPAPSKPTPKVDLRADVNRNGTVDLDDPTEDEGEATWDATHGAIFLANIDDDLGVCPTKDDAGRTLSDEELPKCHDAANEVVDGDDDLLDLARLKTVPWPEVPAAAAATIAVDEKAAPFVRLFKKTADGFVALGPGAQPLGTEEVAAGVELAIEAKDIVRDPAVWDGYVDVTLRLSYPGEPEGAFDAFDEKDTVRLRVAPVLLFHHGLAAQKVFASNTPGSDASKFRSDLGKATSSAKVPGGFETLQIGDGDPWTQDFFETGFMSMPAPGGAQHVMHVAMRSANVFNPRSAKYPLRPAGRVVFTRFRGKDSAAIQEFDPKHDSDMDSLDSFGNTETIPPYEHGGTAWPLGRILRGSIESFHTDPLFERMLAAQEVQRPLHVDTSWLLVGHVDETLSFVPKPAGAASPRSFWLLANDPRLAKQMFEEQVAKGNGATKLFVGKYWLGDKGEEFPAETTIDAVLADPDVMAESARSAAEVDAQVAILKDETGLGDDEIVKIPFLHQPVYGLSLAYQPGTVNGVLLDATHFAAPDPHGPVIDGKDIMKVQLEATLAEKGVQVSWVEDWDAYHRNFGEVHCGSNVIREIPSTKWWEAAK